MGIGAPHAEGAHPRPPRQPVGHPVGKMGLHVEGAVLEIDLGIGRGEVDGGWNLLVVQGEDGLDQPGHARGRVQMPDIRLHRADGAEAGLIGVLPKDLGQGLDLDGIAQHGARAVGLDVGDGGWVHPGQHLGRGDGLGLAVHAGRGVAHLAGAVVVDGRAPNESVNHVPILQCVLQTLEHDEAHALARDRALGVGGEGAAMAVGREDAPFLVEIARFLRDTHGDAPGQGHVAFVIDEGLAGQMHGHQGGGTRGLHGHAGPAQVELVGHPGGEEILVVAQGKLVGLHRLPHQPVPHQIVKDISVHAHPGEDADEPVVRIGIVPRPLQRFPRRLQKDALLGIENIGFARIKSEKTRIEQIGAIQMPARVHIVGMVKQLGIDPGGLHLLAGEKMDGLDALGQIAPEGFQVLCTRKAPRHANDGDVVVLTALLGVVVIVWIRVEIAHKEILDALQKGFSTRRHGRHREKIRGFTEKIPSKSYLFPSRLRSLFSGKPILRRKQTLCGRSPPCGSVSWMNNAPPLYACQEENGNVFACDRNCERTPVNKPQRTQRYEEHDEKNVSIPFAPLCLTGVWRNLFRSLFTPSFDTN